MGRLKSSPHLYEIAINTYSRGMIKIALICILLFIVAIIVTLAKGKQGTQARAYKQVPVMTNAEATLFRRLLQEFPEYYVFPQVSMGAILRPAASNRQQNLIAFRAISQKRVDFVICNQALETLCLLELDDSTHRQTSDAARDKTTGSAGYKTVRLRGNPATLNLEPLMNTIRLLPALSKA